MKKIAALFVAILYLAVSSGLAVEIHQCMGRVLNFSFVHHETKTCGKCGMPKGSQNCCKSELKFVKIQDAYKLVSTAYQLSIPEQTISSHFNITGIYLAANASTATFNCNAPPPYSAGPLRILNGVFRI